MIGVDTVYMRYSLQLQVSSRRRVDLTSLDDTRDSRGVRKGFRQQSNHPFIIVVPSLR